MPPSNDECVAPLALSGAGPFAYDNSSATTSTIGQGCPASTLGADLWFCWTAPTSGSFDVTTVGLSTLDTRIAVYTGCGCPTAGSIGCDDDSCGTFQSRVTLVASAGSTFTIQIGNLPGSAGGASAFDIVPTPGPSTGCSHDDGTSEISVGLTAGGDFLWLQPFGAAGVPKLVTSVSVAYGTPLLPGTTPPIGTPVEACVYEDPNDDGDPSDAVLVSRASNVIGNVDNDVLDTYAVPPAFLDGVFFVGVALTHAANTFPAAHDMNFCGAPHTLVRAWGVGSTPGTLDFDVLTNNPIPPTNLTLAFGGVWMLRAGCAASSATSFCGNADPNRIPCPCGNDGTDPLAGCANSQNAAGARMSATGFAPTNDVVLHATGMSGTLCLFIRTLGPQQTSGAVFGDGVTCTGGSLLRLRAVPFVGGIGGTASFPVPPETVTLATRSGTFPGSGATMQYSCFYRNAAGFCPPSTFNTPNTLSLTW